MWLCCFVPRVEDEVVGGSEGTGDLFSGDKIKNSLNNQLHMQQTAYGVVYLRFK